MALDTLKGITHIGGEKVDRVNWRHEKSDRIQINDDHNSLTVKLQDGPIKENGVNGCQVDVLFYLLRGIFTEFQRNYPCPENAKILAHLGSSIMLLEERTRRRTKAGTEGTNSEEEFDVPSHNGGYDVTTKN